MTQQLELKTEAPNVTDVSENLSRRFFGIDGKKALEALRWLFSFKEEKPVKKNQPRMIARIFQKIAHKIGATIVMESEWNYVGQIIFKNGKKRYFRSTSLDINTMGSSNIAKDKGYANFFMKEMGYPTVPGQTFFAEKFAKKIGSERNIDAAYQYAKDIGFPVIVKPNSGSQGNGVALVHTKAEFYRAMKAIFAHDDVALVQQQVKGKDYRVVVLDNKIISAYERIPLNVIGDGESTILQLLEKKQDEFKKSGRDTVLKLDDPRIKEKLKQSGLKLKSVVPKGKQVFLLDNANLSSGGDSVDVTDKINPEFRDTSIRLTKDMGLRLCGVDLMIEGDISEAPDKYWVLEINSAPGLDHYAKSGPEQEQIVEDMYLEVLKAMEADSEKS